MSPTTAVVGSVGNGPIAGGLVVVVLLATLGEGGATPGWMLIWHGLLMAILATALLLPRAAAGSRFGVAAGPAGGLVLFAVIALAGAWLAPYGYAAWLFLLELGAFLAVLGLSARCGPTLLPRLGPALLVGAWAQSAWVIVSFLAGERRPAGTFLNANHLAGWLGSIALLVFGSMLIRNDETPRRPFVFAAVVPIFAAMFLTGSRGAVVGLAAGGAMLLVIGRRRLTPGRRRLIVGLALIFALLAAGLIARRLGEADPFRYQRVKIWRASLQAVLESPLTGAGPRQFAFAARNLQFPDGDGPLRYDRGFTATHSDLLRVPCELGWPGAAALIVVLLATAAVLRSRHRAGELGGRECAAIAALTALAVQSVVDNLSHRPAVYLLAAVLMGTLLSAPREGPWRFRRGARLAWVGLLALVFVVGDVAPYLAWSAARRDTSPDEGRARSLSRVGAALRLNPVHPDYRRSRAMLLAADGEDWGLDEYADARESAEHAIRLSPADSDTYWTLAQIEAIACRTLFRDVASRQRARAQFERAERLSRYNAVIPLTVARFLLDTGDPAGARRAAERVLALEPESIQARLLLADALLSGPGPLAGGRPASLLAEAEERARRGSDGRPEGSYAGELLGADLRIVDRVRRKLAAATGAAPQEITR